MFAPKSSTIISQNDCVASPGRRPLVRLASLRSYHQTFLAVILPIPSPSLSVFQSGLLSNHWTLELDSKTRHFPQLLNQFIFYTKLNIGLHLTGWGSSHELDAFDSG
jgi:hypothetical protein